MTKPSDTNLTDMFAIACPGCGQADRLEIAITASATVTAQGLDNVFGVTWRDDSDCRCPSCQWKGTYAQTRLARQPDAHCHATTRSLH